MDRPARRGCHHCHRWKSCPPPQVGPAPSVRLASSDGNPLAGMPFYVNPNSAAMRAAQQANPPSPELTLIANTPQAYWIVPGGSAATVGKYAGDAAAAGAPAGVLDLRDPAPRLRKLCRGRYGVWRRIPGLDRRHRRGSGAPAPAAVILEPDALAMADCLQGDQRQERYDLIRYAVEALTRDPNAAVYIDAGHLRWHSAEDMAARLNNAGIARARGFSVNTANFYTTEDETGYGEAISG